MLSIHESSPKGGREGGREDKERTLKPREGRKVTTRLPQNQDS